MSLVHQHVQHAHTANLEVPANQLHQTSTANFASVVGLETLLARRTHPIIADLAKTESTKRLRAELSVRNQGSWHLFTIIESAHVQNRWWKKKLSVEMVCFSLRMGSGMTV
jgi:hypothetical protein